MCWSAPAGPAVGLTARNSVLFVRGAEKSEWDHPGTTIILKGWNQLAQGSWHYPILKGWNQLAQGCEERATLGLPPPTPTTLKGLHQSVRPVPVVVSTSTKWIS